MKSIKYDSSGQELDDLKSFVSKQVELEDKVERLKIKKKEKEEENQKLLMELNKVIGKEMDSSAKEKNVQEKLKI